MEFMKKIVLSACFLSIVITIADSIKPGDKFSSQLKMIFSLVFITGIFSAGLKCVVNIDFPVMAEYEYNEIDRNLEDAVEEAVIYETKSKINEEIEGLLNEKNISFDKISVDINIEEDNCININKIDYIGNSFEKAKAAIIENLGNVEVNYIE